MEEAIRAFTIGGAYTSHEENKKGSIIPGQLADLVILDQDPAAIDPAALPNVRVLATFVGGRQVYGQLTSNPLASASSSQLPAAASNPSR